MVGNGEWWIMKYKWEIRELKYQNEAHSVTAVEYVY